MSTRKIHPMANLLILAGVALPLMMSTAQAATIEVTSRDAPGVGFNDPTPVAPVGGNTGRTLGEQRRIVYRYVADIYQKALNSNVQITVNAGWESLDCNATGAVLGSAMPYNVWYDFPGAPVPGTWYPQALANKISGLNLANYYGQQDDGSGYGNVDIKTQFNVGLGSLGCLTGMPFYLGLDGQADGMIDFASVLLHELGHGLGFSLLTTDPQSGDRFQDKPSIWESFMYDNAAGKTWLQMEWWERATSATTPENLAWLGPQTVAAVPQVLGLASMASLRIGGANAAGLPATMAVGTAEFGPAVSSVPLEGSVVRLVDQVNGTGTACTALSSVNAAAVSGKVALIDRGSCDFVAKVRNVQRAGAKAVLVADNVDGPIGSMAGSASDINIPSVRILKKDGDALKAALQVRVRGKPAPQITAALSSSLTGRYAGADGSGRPLLYTPAAFSPGSSVSHWDTSLTPNMLMEPFFTPHLSLTLTTPNDLTLPLLKDIGW